MTLAFLVVPVNGDPHISRVYANPETKIASNKESEILTEEDLAELLEISGIDREMSDQEIYSLVNEYLENLESGEITTEGFSEDKIIDPQLQMQTGNHGRIRYILPDGRYFESSIPNGMLSSESVTMWLPDGVMGIVTKDGELVLKYNEFQLDEPGDYQVTMTFLSFAMDDGGISAVYEVNHKFTILSKAVKDISRISAPEGFKIVSAAKDGTVLAQIDGRELLFFGDGVYEIKFETSGSNKISYASTINLDTEPPVILFSEDITKGTVKGPVEFTSPENDAVIYISYNGRREEASTNVLSVPGNYRLEIFDTAGNYSSYTVEIRQSWKIFEPQMVIMTLLVLLGVTLKIVMQRRNIKVL